MHRRRLTPRYSIEPPRYAALIALPVQVRRVRRSMLDQPAKHFAGVHPTALFPDSKGKNVRSAGHNHDTRMLWRALSMRRRPARADSVHTAFWNDSGTTRLSGPIAGMRAWS
jgi:hypothetical protein